MGVQHQNIVDFSGVFFRGIQGEFNEALQRFSESQTLDTIGAVMVKARSIALHVHHSSECREFLCGRKEAFERLRTELRENLSLARNFVRWSELLSEIETLLKSIEVWAKGPPPQE